MWFLASRLDRHLGSFKFRLAAFFLLLALLPLLGAVWAFSEVADRGETGRADARLHAELRVALADVRTRAEGAKVKAESLARTTAFQQAFERSSTGDLQRLYREVPNAAFYERGQFTAGSRPAPLAIRREAVVEGANGRRIGRVVAWVPLNADLVEELRARHFADEDMLALVSGGQVVVGPSGLDAMHLASDGGHDVSLAGESYRALATQLANGEPDAALVGLTPKSLIEAQAADLRRKMLLLALLALGIGGGVAYLLGRTIVRSLKNLSDAAGAIAQGDFSSRVPVRGRDEFAGLARSFNDMAIHLENHLEELSWERVRARDAISRFGEALAATHNPYLLLPVIVESIVEATGAAGGRLVVDKEEVATTSDTPGGGEPLTIPLADDGSAVLYLTPRETDFTDESRELAYWLASQARTALENATLHKRLEQAALMDGLTELPNRRQFEDSLAQELSRVERFGGALALVVADLDDFKGVNDRYGHLAGDDVLRAFAEVLRANVRDVDTAARYGGEEFAVLLPGTDLAGAERVAERIRAEMEERVVATAPALNLRVTASFGIAAYPESPTEEALFAAADDALYSAKASGKNRVTVSGEATARAATVRRHG